MKKKLNLSAKNRRFITSAGGGVEAQKIKVEKRISFFIGHEVLFYETTFSASALEHWVQITLRQRRQIGVMPKQTDREADYMCFSPLQQKKSELEGAEEYTRKLVYRNSRFSSSSSSSSPSLFKVIF
jgi:hypothetical protein